MGGRVVAAADAPLEPEGALARVLAGYRLYLLLERGVSETTVACYEPRARRSCRSASNWMIWGWTG